MNKEQLKFIKKIYDNSFYPATYNIENNSFEYPKSPDMFYFYCPEMVQEFMNKYALRSTELIVKKFPLNIIYK